MPNNAFGLTALTDMSKQLKTVERKFANGIRKNLRAGVKDAGAEVLSEVRKRAGWSSRIPAATALSTRFNIRGASVRIQVNSKKAPHARPLEVGNSRGGRSGELRHPVFHAIGEPGGFATMPLRPFFFPAIEAKGKNIDQTFEKVAIQTARDAGFK